MLLRNPPSDQDDSANEIVCGDLMSVKDCERYVRGLDVIFYLAHTNTPVNSDFDQPNDALVNMVPLLTFLQVIENQGSQPHLVYFSSGGAVYGRSPDRIPFRETDACLPLSSYGIQKLAAEHYLRLASERGKLTCSVLRVGNAYGTLLPPHRMQGLIGVAINNALNKRPVRVFGNLANVRDYVHLNDVCVAAEKAIQTRGAFQVFNIGSGQGHSVAEVLRIIEACVGVSPEIETAHDGELGRGLADWIVLDIAKAGAELGWRPTVQLREGIRRMIGEWHDNG